MRLISTTLHIAFIIVFGFSVTVWLRALFDPVPPGDLANIERLICAGSGFVLSILLLLLTCFF